MEDKAADKMVDIIQEMINQKGRRSDSVELCCVVGVGESSYYTVRPVTDIDGTNIAKVVNMTPFDLSVNDFCYVFKIGNSFTNAFICYAKGDTTLKNTALYQQIVDSAIAPLQKQIEELKKSISSIEINGEPDLPDARGEYF